MPLQVSNAEMESVECNILVSRCTAWTSAAQSMLQAKLTGRLTARTHKRDTGGAGQSLKHRVGVSIIAGGIIS